MDFGCNRSRFSTWMIPELVLADSQERRMPSRKSSELSEVHFGQIGANGAAISPSSCLHSSDIAKKRIFLEPPDFYVVRQELKQKFANGCTGSV